MSRLQPQMDNPQEDVCQPQVTVYVYWLPPADSSVMTLPLVYGPTILHNCLHRQNVTEAHTQPPPRGTPPRGNLGLLRSSYRVLTLHFPD